MTVLIWAVERTGLRRLAVARAVAHRHVERRRVMELRRHRRGEGRGSGSRWELRRGCSGQAGATHVQNRAMLRETGRNGPVGTWMSELVETVQHKINAMEEHGGLMEHDDNHVILILAVRIKLSPCQKAPREEAQVQQHGSAGTCSHCLLVFHPREQKVCNEGEDGESCGESEVLPQVVYFFAGKGLETQKVQAHAAVCHIRDDVRDEKDQEDLGQR